MAQVGPQLPPAAYAADAAAAPPAIQQINTYSAKFASLGDAYGGAYLPLLESHRPNAQLTPAVVLQTALTLSAHEGLPGVYAYQVPGSYEIHTVHRLGYASSLPGVAAPWDGILFAFEGDVVHPGLVNLVQIPGNSFHLTTAVAAPTAATLGGHWAGVAAEDACVGPFELGDGDVTPVITRRFMPVPIAYVPAMHNRALTPREAWQVAEQIIADGRAADCEIFLDFLRAACTYRTPAAAGEPHAAAAVLPAPLAVPIADEALRKQVWSWLVHDLPALAAPAANTVENQFMATSIAVRQELALSRAEAAADRTEARAPKTVSSAYPTAAPRLWRLCGVDSDDALPTFWKEHATTGGKKHQSMACLQQLVSDRADEPGSAQSQIVVSVALFECISHFRLGAADPSNILEGVTPFLICPQYYHRAPGTRLDCNTYGLLTAGSGAAVMAEVRELTEPKLMSPRDATELSAFIGGYSCLIDCLIGDDHAAAARLRAHATFWRAHAQALASMVGAEHLAGYLMRIMRSVQLVTIGYINSALKLGTAAPLPDYGRIEEAVRNCTLHNLSQLPLHYLEVKAAPAAAPRAPTVSVPAAPSTTPATAQAANTRLSVRVDAPAAQQQADWKAKFAASKKEIKDLKVDPARPKVCLSYHLRGTCYESCRERSTHRALNATEKAAVQTYLEESL